jgi:TM2 domain-containing membrane protein YozV
MIILVYYLICWLIICIILIIILALELEKNYKKEIERIDKYYNDELNYRLDYVEYVV